LTKLKMISKNITHKCHGLVSLLKILEFKH
jgi:hypothetical protein